MKKFHQIGSLLVLLLMVSSQGFGQITIPNANFAAAIRAVCPTCIDASNKLLPAATRLTTLNVRRRGIDDLTGIEGFSALQTVICDSNQLTTLPKLPNSLLRLDCFSNQITDLGTLPPNLQSLRCYLNKITVLPALPNSITYIECYSNQITSLPTLPDRLQDLNCYQNKLSTLPVLPISITGVTCGGNQITSLPTLPNNLLFLYCDNNQLTDLPDLPSRLTFLNCGGNKITKLPTLPTNLTQLSCYNNQLTNLPTLPNTLTGLNISNNPASIFPVLPAGLKYLQCNGNKLTKLPDLPKALEYLECSSNSLTGLPTLPTTLRSLYFGGNLLSDFPVLPAGLQFLGCWSHKFNKLPELPRGLTYLECSSNQLTELPTLPSTLRSLFCGSNPLNKLPTLPNTLQFLVCLSTQITCLPTLPASLRELGVDPTKIQCLPNVVDKLVVFKQRTGNNANDVVATPPVCSAIVTAIDTKMPVICAGASATLTATACKVGTVKWSNNATGVSITVSPEVATTYTAVCSTVCSDGPNSNAVTVTISGIKPTVPDVSTIQNALCLGETTTLAATNCNGIIKWSNNLTTNSIVVSPTVTTTYTATCQNNCGVSANSKDVVVTLKPVVAKPTITGAKVLCPNLNAILNNSVLEPGNTYQWKRNGQEVATTAALTINGEGTYVVTVTKNGCNSKSDDFVVRRSLISASLAGKNNYCAGSNTILTATALNADGALQYQWKLDGKNVGDSKPTWAAIQPGSYTVEITDVNTCKAAAPALNVIENGSDIVSVVKPDGPHTIYAPNSIVLSATLGYEKDPRFKYQWRKDGQDMPGTTTPVFEVKTSGSYAATISQADCAVTSAEVKVVVLVPTAVMLNATDELRIYPNPTDGLLNLSATLRNKNNIELKLLDTQGRILQTLSPLNDVRFEQSIDMTQYASGTYLLEVAGKDFLKRINIVKR